MSDPRVPFGSRWPWKLASGLAVAVVALVLVWGAVSAPHLSPPAPVVPALLGSDLGAGGRDPTTLTSPSVQSGEAFGDAVATAGPYVVVGAAFERADGFAQAGHAWVFDTKSGTVTKLTSPNAQATGHFGFSVAISGTTVLVGAPLESVPGGSGAGRAYTFSAVTGDLIASYVCPSIQADEGFGWSVAISGTTAVIGAPLETAHGFADAGHAWIFNTTTGASIKLTSFTPQFPGDFGQSVAIAGSTVVVGAPEEASAGFSEAGNVYTFDATTGTLLAAFGSTAPQVQGVFGFSVAIHGSKVAVGAPGQEADNNVGAGVAYLFGATSGIQITMYYSPSIESNESFGYSVAINATELLVGAPFETALGHSQSGHAWSLVIATGTATKLTSPNAQSDGEYGWSVTMDKTTAVVGAPGETVSGDASAGHAYEY
jgi:FG-GAP repeat